MRKRLDIKAVWDSDLQVLLENLGIWEELLLGEVTCLECQRVVSLENLGTIIPREDGAEVTCDDPQCLRAVTARHMLPAHD